MESPAVTNFTLPQASTGYCTNVHAGTDLQSIKQNLDDYATPVRQKLRSKNLGVGLWIPDQASRQLAGGEVAGFADFLTQRELNPFTINGFPFDNFHQEHVKQRVYLPAWWDARRLEYTQRLAEILRFLLPGDDCIGSISTLPIGWPDNPFELGPFELGPFDSGPLDSQPFESEHAVDNKSLIAIAGENFRRLSAFLQKLEKQSGRRIVVAIEPEPGCILDTIGDMIAFFAKELPDDSHRRYITACHDICHSAVMMEDQADVIGKYAAAGIGIGKVQVSSAIVVDWLSMSNEDKGAALMQLSQFAEDRYLHQTGCRSSNGGFQLATDLPELLAASRGESLDQWDRWVIHFHVPIFLERFGNLTTSRDDVLACLRALSEHAGRVEFTGHLEVETYAWTVLPESMRSNGLAEDIAGELAWLHEQLA